MRKLQLLVLFLATSLAGCSEGNDNGDGTGGEGGKDIALAPGTPKDYTIYADETSGTPSEGISFTTTGPWRATVARTRTDASDGSSWVTVFPDRGDAAGDYTIEISLGVNTTGKSRKATITIECGATKIKITVEQKGTTEEGEVPDEGDEPVVPDPSERKMVARIEQTIDYWSGCNDRFDTETYVFRYDDRDRIAEYTVEADRDGELIDRRVCRLDYSIAGEIRVEEVSGFSDIPDHYTLSLNDMGYVRHVELPACVSGERFASDFEYDGEGRLVRQEWSEDGSSGWVSYTYLDGVLSGGTTWDEMDGENSADGLEAWFGDVENDLLNIDPNALFMGGMLYDTEHYVSDIPGRLDRLALLRLVGRGSDRYVVYYEGGDQASAGMGVPEGWPEPNVVVRKSFEYCDYEWDETLRYAFNDDGSISTVSQEEICTRMRYEYDIVAGNELIDPYYPERGYKYTIENETRTRIGSGKNVYTYGFSYR